ncbi:Putative uncharacterized protein [Taphrina deformans PYCC 5710]|uniref:Golgi apparatus membrane protein TVP38 n=1 Tax=Taphrina deformans (strain PYCC 5710 / ATCC 11124 / CBS 356.35 / IMI 108563 / JCM 9778 / NBRC 8474) TaxID=1097556 RepID=R4XHC9_TAPDE|nr:Putative uncharacterized protein [Taphrina deformans PYCC 5710]|eukprot:CCG82817.1 Putative uncharacterized protein [Taphrina deformans PYCC 5710]
MSNEGFFRKAWTKYNAIPLRKRILYTTIFVVWHVILLVIAIFSNRFQKNLQPLASRMDHMPESWLILSALIAFVSIPPLFGHELLAIIAGYVYGAEMGFLILTVSSVIGESMVYFAFRYWLRGRLDAFRRKHQKNYGVFVAVVDDGGILMLWLIRMSIIPPHFSTPLFSSLNNITWWKWMLANICASPVKFFPPIFIGTLLRNKENNSIFGDLAFGISSVVTIGVLWHIRQSFIKKKKELKDRLAAQELSLSQVRANNAELEFVARDENDREKSDEYYAASTGLVRSLTLAPSYSHAMGSAAGEPVPVVRESARQCVIEVMTGTHSTIEMTTGMKDKEQQSMA